MTTQFDEYMGGAELRKKQTVNAILHLPSDPQALARIDSHMRNFYITQVEKQLNNYGLTKEQKLEVVALLVKDYHQKAENENH